jgi:hypothetical protein
VGRLVARERPFPEAGELLAVEALDRAGVLVTSEGVLVRYLRVAPKNPLVMSDGERARVSHAFGQLVARVAAGQSLQFYVEAAPVRLDALLARSRAEADRGLAPLERSSDPELRQRAGALRRLHGALERSLELHADEQAAIEIGYHVVVPYLPDQGLRVDWRSVLPLRRTLESHRRVVRESLQLTDSIRADLEALDLSTRLLSGPEVADLLWRRFNPTCADRTPEGRPGAQPSRLEVLGQLDAAQDTREAAMAALRLRELLAASAQTADGQRQLRIDRDLEQTIYVATPPDATYFAGCSRRWRCRARSRSRSTCTRSIGCASGRGTRPATGACSGSTAAPSSGAGRPTTRCWPARTRPPSCSRS